MDLAVELVEARVAVIDAGGDGGEKGYVHVWLAVKTWMEKTTTFLDSVEFHWIW